MECVVHYSSSSRTFSQLKSLSKNQYEKLLQAKSIREKEPLEENRHAEQCKKIPDEDTFKSSTHGVHLQPCY